MKANDFIKKFGVHIADHCLNDCASPDDRWFIHHGALIDGEDFDKLKRYVEAYELVEVWGGLSNAKKSMKDDNCLLTVEIEKAITLVEECQ